jgi:tetratricopeptide (TPR) repeat protein
MKKLSATVAVLAVVLVAVGAGAYWWTRQATSGSASTPGVADVAPVYVGSAGCATCHADEARAWTGSQHQLAMQHAGPGAVLGNFDDATFSYAGVASRFFRRDGKYFVRTDGPDGQLADFEIKYTFGVDPLQQYLIELPRGQVQALSIAWDARPADAGGQRWFHLYPDGQVDHRDELHWTRRQQNWNFMCADCHSTNVQKNYDPETQSYATTYSEISVGCEACHGPGSGHVAWAQTKNDDDPAKGLAVSFHERRGVSWTRDAQTGQPRRSVARATEAEIQVCAQCHARRAQIAEGYRPGAPFAEHYLPAVLTPSLYHPDGQQRDEVFIWGSWLQSRMHQAGVTCSDCHDPHTQKLRAPGNLVCAQCHDASKYDATTHHRHPSGSTGALCAACHMPQETYMVVDPRRDHSMRVPRPDQTVSLGVPNACNACHREVDAKWAAAQVRSWLGRNAKGVETFAAAFNGAERGEMSARTRLSELSQSPAPPAIVRASALQRLGASGAADPGLIARACHDPDVLVRLAAATVAESLPPTERRILTPLLRDAHRAVRIEAARVMAAAVGGLNESSRSEWQAAAQEYLQTLRYNADRPEANVALGTFEGTLGRNAEARAAFEAAIRLDPAFEPAYVNAADTLRAVGDEAGAVAILREGLEQVPKGASLHHALGLAWVRQRDMPAAIDALRRASELAPDVPRYAYVYAVGLNSTGRATEALRTLELAVRRWPADRDLSLALASFQAEAGRTDDARRTLTSLRERFPGDRDVQALMDQLR